MKRKGIISILEVMVTGVILILAFIHFFPQYSIKTKWDRALIGITVRDTLNTIDRMNKTYELATDTVKFNQFMGNLFKPEQINTTMIWWKKTEGLEPIYIEDMPTPYFTEGYVEMMIDVVNTTSGYKVYSFTIGLGYPY